MPYIREWDREAEKQGMHFLEHIAWVKRNGNPSRRLYRSHEEIFIYAIGNRKEFYQTQGKYEDVKLPGVLLDVVSIEAIKRYISDLQGRLKGTAKKTRREKLRHHSSYERLHVGIQERSPRYANFTNVWSFLPESKKTYNKEGKKHPTIKPLSLVERLVEMLTAEGGSVTDWGSGYGTTALACQRLARPYLCIEKVEEFHRASVERLKNDVWQPSLFKTGSLANNGVNTDKTRAASLS